MIRNIAFPLALVCAVPALAQTPAAAPAARPADPATAALARELVATMGLRQTMQATMDRTLADLRAGNAISAQLDRNANIRLERAKNPQAWDAAIGRIGAKQAAMMQKVLTDMQPEIEARSIQIYANNFTAAELRELLAFYRTPLGKKITSRLPEISAETTRWVQQEIPRRIAPAMQALAPEIQKELAPLLPKPPQQPAGTPAK
ncbi:DUF2059 domain-containing protein [Sphingomonas quercus]|uniref:DUF2059 domain-containing protein n=1 Tax=Sphingomonas quercus TaxID=2842451 RepID=A0ABS6BHE0_9SPHN|nr:DUF2059 domain-containing protein [Sphingomonas quercus]MBU3077717.1 DUF2059 domain-containing protein [Sphingomonas quercus]